MDDPWAAIAAISALVNTLVVVIAVLYTRSQLREAARARSATVALDFRARHEAEPIRRVRRRLLKGGYGDLTNLTEKDHDELELLIDHYETLAMLVELRLLDEDVARTMFEYTPLRVWAAAKPWVLDMRRSAPGYGRFFEQFAAAQARPERGK